MASSPTTSSQLFDWSLPLAGMRVRLRQLRTGDLQDFQAYRTDHEVARFQGWTPMSDHAALDFIRSMHAVEGPRRGEWVQLAIAMLDDDRIVGDVGIHLNEGGVEAELGISFARPHQRRGLAKEAMRLLIDRLFQQGACSIKGVIDSQNTPSLRLVESLGFQASRVVATTFRGAPCIEITYLLTPDDYSAACRHRGRIKRATP